MHVVPALRRHRLEARRRRGRAARGALRLLARELGQQRLADANIPRRYQHCTIANFTAYNESLERAADKARQLAERFPVVNKGLFFEGQPGVGKTHLAVAVLKQVIQTTGARGLFYDTRDLLRVIRSTYDPSIRTTELEILRPVMTADLLVLDDLGAEKTSEWVEETMNLIVNTRYNERRADDLHLELPGHSRRHRTELAGLPHRPPDALAPARDVRVRRPRRRRLPARCRPTAASTT